MKKKIVIFLSYIILFFNSNLLSDENDKKLKIGLLAPLTGEYADLGKSLLYSLQLALDEINDNDVFIIPRDTGFRNKTKLNLISIDNYSSGSFKNHNSDKRVIYIKSDTKFISKVLNNYKSAQIR